MSGMERVLGLGRRWHAIQLFDQVEIADLLSRQGAGHRGQRAQLTGQPPCPRRGREVTQELTEREGLVVELDEQRRLLAVDRLSELRRADIRGDQIRAVPTQPQDEEQVTLRQL